MNSMVELINSQIEEDFGVVRPSTNETQVEEIGSSR